MQQTTAHRIGHFRDHPRYAGIPPRLPIADYQHLGTPRRRPIRLQKFRDIGRIVLSVPVQRNNHRRRCRLHTRGHRLTLAAVFPVLQNLEIRAFLGKGGEHLPRFIAGPVIHINNFKIFLQHAADLFNKRPDIAGFILHRNNNGNLGPLRHIFLFLHFSRFFTPRVPSWKPLLWPLSLHAKVADMKQDNDDLLARTDLSGETARNLTARIFSGATDGDLFLESRRSESFVLDDGRIRNADVSAGGGFSLRMMRGEAVGTAHNTEISRDRIKAAAENLHVPGQTEPPPDFSLPAGPRALYDPAPPFSVSTAERLSLLSGIDARTRARDPRICQVTAVIHGEDRQIRIFRPDGTDVADRQPLTVFRLSVIMEKDGRRERGSFGLGGRYDLNHLLTPENVEQAITEALRQADVNMQAKPAPAGELPVILGPGWPAVLLHEAVGHGLEADFHFKRISAFTDMIGQQVAARGVSIVDDATFTRRRGSLNVDDEGTPGQRTVLIEDGILKNVITDRRTARLLGREATGNGRRQSYAHTPFPRMTNSFMASGDSPPEEIIAAVDYGIYAPNFSGGQVDIVSGAFVFSASEAYLVEKGKITAPLKGVTLAGNGPGILKKVKMIGTDSRLDPGIGTCGKNGQSVPVGVGQPTLLVDPLTVGGTEA